MSDPKYGEPVEETTPSADATSADDAVASAHEGLADAEAASRDVAVDESVAPAPVEPLESTPAPAEAAEPVVTASEPVHGSLYANDPVDEAYVPGAYSDPVAPAEVVAPVVAPAPQPIFVQAPEAPRPRGNRAAAGLIGVLAAIVFGLLYLGAALGLGALAGDVTGENLGAKATSALTGWWFWVPVVVFFLAFWFLGAIINRGRWGAWVIFGLLVGAAAYGGHILGQLFQAPFWQLTASQGEEVVRGQVLAPLAIAAFVFGRELTIWFGAWVAARGKRVSELNREAQREYERTLEAGPRVHQG